MDAPAPRQFGGVDDCVEAVLAKVGRRIALCTPIGAGKPVALVNAFYRRAVAEPRIVLSIRTGLTLARPRPKSELRRLKDAWELQKGWRILTEVNNSVIGVFYVGTALLFFLRTPGTSWHG